MLRMGEMICNGQGDVSDYLAGEWIRKSAQASVRCLAERKEVPAGVLEVCLSAIDQSLRLPDGLAECLRVRLCCSALPQLDQLVPCDDLETLVDHLLETCYSGEPIDSQETVPDDGRVEWRRRHILSLLRGHPHPFDKPSTARLLAESVAHWVEDLDYPREPRTLDLVGQWRRFRRCVRGRWWWRQTRWWPEQLTPDFPFEWMGVTDHARGKLAELSEDIEDFDEKVFASMQPPTDADVATCRDRLRRVANPVGLILVAHLMPVDVSDCMFRYRAALQETRGALAQRLHG